MVEYEDFVETINIKSYEHIKAIKVAIKEGNVWT